MTIYKCQNCGWEGNCPPPACNLLNRLKPGDAYTDRECPLCRCLIHETPETPETPTPGRDRPWTVIGLHPSYDGEPGVMYDVRAGDYLRSFVSHVNAPNPASAALRVINGFILDRIEEDGAEPGRGSLWGGIGTCEEDYTVIAVIAGHVDASHVQEWENWRLGVKETS